MAVSAAAYQQPAVPGEREATGRGDAVAASPALDQQPATPRPLEEKQQAEEKQWQRVLQLISSQQCHENEN